MSRAQFVKKAMECIKKLEDSRDLSYIDEKFSINDHLEFLVICSRMGEDCPEAAGEPIFYEFYIYRDGEAVEGETESDPRRYFDILSYMYRCATAEER